MFSPRYALPCLAFCALGLPLFAQQDAPSVNATSILRELAQMEQSQKMALQSSEQAVMNQLQAGAESGPAASELYENAKKAVDFQGLRGDAAAFQQWKKDNDVLLHNRDMQTALMLQLRYLVLSIEQKAAPKPDTLLPQTTAYLADLMATQRLFAQEDSQAAQTGDAGKRSQGNSRDSLSPDQTDRVRKVLSESLGSSIFVKWLGIDSWLPDGGSWELTSGNVAGILEKDIRPILREKKNIQLLATWDTELQYEADLATMQRLSHSADQFNNIDRPKLIYNRALDMVALGQKNRAVTEILTLVRTYPQHPDFATWVAQIRQILTPPAAPAASPAA